MSVEASELRAVGEAIGQAMLVWGGIVALVGFGFGYLVRWLGED